VLNIHVEAGERELQIIKLATGQRPPDDSDCIRIEELADGRFALTGTALCEKDEETESVTLVETRHYDSMAEAEEAGLVWANAQQVKILHVGSGTLANPIALNEIDRPL
jgi:hypothetical protein